MILEHSPVIPAKMAARRIHLEASSLYVATLPLPNDGAFHWWFTCVDSGGKCSRHHWTTYTNDLLGPEKYVEEPLPNGAPAVMQNLPVLGFYRISNYTLVDVDTFRNACSQVFKEASLKQQKALPNRAAGISCRTWVTTVITQIISEERAQEVERVVRARSKMKSDEYATCSLWGRPYTTVVEDV